MSNPLANWWRSRQFNAALKQGNIRLAQQLLEETQRAGARLSLLEKVFRDKLQSEQSSAQYEREALILREQISQASQTIEELSRDKQQVEQALANMRRQMRQQEQQAVSDQQQLAIRAQHLEELRKQHNEITVQKQTLKQIIAEKQQEVTLVQQKLDTSVQELTNLRSQIQLDDCLVKPNLELVNLISNKFKLIEQDQYKIQCTGIDTQVFDAFEADLTNFLSEEFNKFPQERLPAEIKKAHEDIRALRTKQDPEYNFYLTPHIYFSKYFLENVYSAYLAWFLIYKHGLLRKKINLLDIAAGPGTVAYGIALFLQSSSRFLQVPKIHICYDSLEKQSSFQYRGLQFWRRYIESQKVVTNTYFRFDTIDIFAEDNNLTKIPQKFFDFIVISHCFFADQKQREKSYEIYKQIFRNHLTDRGYVLIIVQGTKLFRAYNTRQSENITQEQSVIEKFVEELGLSLEWYKYIISTGTREFIADYANMVKDLPIQKFMSPFKRQYLRENFDSHYTIDDYVILAKR